MGAGRHLLLVSEEPATATAVAAVLQSNGRLGNDDVCRDLRELVSRLENRAAPAVLVDIDAHATEMLAELEPIIRRFDQTRFIVLSSTMQNDLMLEAMQVGARHFMAKQSIATTLAPVLQRLCAGTAAEGREQHGGVVTVLSAGGGCGATTIAVNLAHEMVEAKAGPVVLGDLDHCYGSVAAYLGLDGEHGLIDLLERSGPIDAELVATTAISASDPLRVLISVASARLGGAAPADYGRLHDTVEACRRVGRWTVLDAPRLPLDVAADLAKSSAATLLVFQLTVKDIRMAKAMLSSLTARGVAPESVIPVVNRYHRRRLMIDLEEARRAMNGASIECLGSDFNAVSRGLNYGQPLAQAAPRSSLRKELQQMAARILDGSLMRRKAGR